MGGLVRIPPTGAWKVYTPANSGLPHKYVSALRPLDSGKVYVGTRGEGVVLFDGKAIGSRFPRLILR